MVRGGATGRASDSHTSTETDHARSRTTAAPAFLHTRDAGAFLGLSPRTLEKLRVTGGGPAYRKLGRRVVYAPDDLRGWADRDRRQSTSEPGPSGR